MSGCVVCDQEIGAGKKLDDPVCVKCSVRMNEIRLIAKVRGCPFCGQKVLNVVSNIHKSKEGTLGQLSCCTCFSAGPWAHGIDKMLELWNVRGKSGDFFRSFGSFDDCDVKGALTCPFCMMDYGLEYMSIGDGVKVYIIGCMVCGSSGPQPLEIDDPQSKKVSILRWNKRVGD